MAFDQFLNYSGWIVGVAGLLFAVWQYRASLSRPRIRSVQTGLRAQGRVSDQDRLVEVVSIGVEVENTGLQAATGCSALVHFARQPALVLYPVVHGRLKKDSPTFTIEGRASMDLCAAWHVSDEGVLLGGKTYADFVAEALPARVVLTHGKQVIARDLTVGEVRSAHERFEQQSHRMLG